MRYMIAEIDVGTVIGTDSEEVANDYSHSQEHFVIDCIMQQWLVEGKPVEVKPVEH